MTQFKSRIVLQVIDNIYIISMDIAAATEQGWVVLILQQGQIYLTF